MTDEQRHKAAEAFWEDEESIAEQTEVMLLLSKKLNFRYRTVQGLSIERKVAHLMKLGNLSDSVAGRLLVTYHLALQRPMMGAFLDALGIAHENGLIAADETPRPDAAKLAEARGDAALGLSARRRPAVLRDTDAAGSRDLGRPDIADRSGAAGERGLSPRITGRRHLLSPPPPPRCPGRRGASWSRVADMPRLRRRGLRRRGAPGRGRAGWRCAWA